MKAFKVAIFVGVKILTVCMLGLLSTSQKLYLQCVNVYHYYHSISQTFCFTFFTLMLSLKSLLPSFSVLSVLISCFGPVMLFSCFYLLNLLAVFLWTQHHVKIMQVNFLLGKYSNFMYFCTVVIIIKSFKILF